MADANPPADFNREAILKMSREEQVAAFADILKNDNRVKVAGVDIDGVHRGKVISKAKFLSAIKNGGMGFCSVIFGWDLHDKTYSFENPISTADSGFADILALPDVATMRRVPWEDNIPLILLDFASTKDKQPLMICPRSLLKNVIQQIDTWRKGVQAVAGVEFEFYNFKESPKSLESKSHQNLTPLTSGMFGYSLLRPIVELDYFYDIMDNLKTFGIPIEGFHTETGPGVYEAALEYGPVLDLADRSQLFKTSTKQLGILQPRLHPGREPIYPSFMAKPYNSLPGCSGHLHLSLMDSDGNNIFYDSTDQFGMSAVFKHFVAGMLSCLPDIVPCFAPTVNSYKRLVENFWAPVMVSWGTENRTAAIRVITPKTSGETACSPKGTRCEMRVPGADINAYIALSACFAAGLYGITQELTLPPPITGDVLKEKDENGDPLERLSCNLGEATKKMRAEGSKAWKILPHSFVRHFTATRWEEWRSYESAVTDWETKRYFELI